MNLYPTNHRESTAVHCREGSNAMGNPGVRAGEELENGVRRPKPSHCSPREKGRAQAKNHKYSADLGAKKFGETFNSVE